MTVNVKKGIYMKRFGIFLILSILIMSMIAPTLAQVGTVASVQIDLSLRVGPGTEWRLLRVLPVGYNVAVDGRDVTGAWVRGITQDGEIGWMAARFLNIGTDGAFPLPIIDREAAIAVSAPPPGVASVTGTAAIVTETVAEEAPAVVAAPAGGVTTTSSTTLNIRSGPSVEYRILGRLSPGEAFNLDGRDATIGWVRGVNTGGIIGWVSVSYTGLTYDQAAGLPIVTVDTPFGVAVPSGPAEQVVDTSPVNVQAIVSTAPVAGFAVGGQVAGFSSAAENAMRSAGMTWVKRQVVYDRGASPNSFAGWINDAHARGFRILLSVKGHPQDISDPNFFNEYAGFVGGLAALGADAIEVWNEMNIDREWPAGQINPASYVQMLAPAYNSIKANNPNTLVISGAPAPTGFFGGCHGNGCDDAPYVAGMAAAGAANYMDCVGIHYNEGIVPPSQQSGDPRSEHYTRYFWGMVNAYRASFSKPLCFTEIGYVSPEGFPPLPGGFAWAGDTSVAEQAAWLGQAVDLAAGSGVVRLFIVWNVDFTQYNSDPQGGYAIIRPDGSCPACGAIAS
jgi:uncharacterized protein YraI